MRRDRLRLQDILEALDSVTSIVGQTPEADFLANELLRYAVAHQLTVVGEPAARLGADVRSKYSSVPWPDIVSLRNILVHEYFGIHWPLVFQTATDHLPALRTEIQTILAAEFPE